jgi:hypothetical protein
MKFSIATWAFLYGQYAEHPWPLERILEWTKDAGFDGTDLHDAVQAARCKVIPVPAPEGPLVIFRYGAVRREKQGGVVKGRVPRRMVPARRKM